MSLISVSWAKISREIFSGYILLFSLLFVSLQKSFLYQTDAKFIQFYFLSLLRLRRKLIWKLENKHLTFNRLSSAKFNKKKFNFYFWILYKSYEFSKVNIKIITTTRSYINWHVEVSSMYLHTIYILYFYFIPDIPVPYLTHIDLVEAGLEVKCLWENLWCHQQICRCLKVIWSRVLLSSLCDLWITK